MQEFVVCHDGRVISVCTLGAAHLSELAEVDEIQYEQHEVGRVVLKVKSKHPVTPLQKEKISRAFSEKTSGGCTVEVIEVGIIERTARGKLQMLKQHLDLNRYFGAVSLARTP
jgi:phenylacetate-CoA ligase